MASHSPERCACGHYQLPPARDACVALSAGVSAQHGRLSCETITLGPQPLSMPDFNAMAVTIGFQRLD